MNSAIHPLRIAMVIFSEDSPRLVRQNPHLFLQSDMSVYVVYKSSHYLLVSDVTTHSNDCPIYVSLGKTTNKCDPADFTTAIHSSIDVIDKT